MNKRTPDFAFFQNDRTRVSAIWMKDVGKWNVLPKEDFPAISIMVNMLRYSPDPQTTLRHIAQSILEVGEGGDLIDE